MFNILAVGNNTFIIIKENDIEDKSYGSIRISKFNNTYGVSLNAISDEVYRSGEKKKLEDKAIEIVKAYLNNI